MDRSVGQRGRVAAQARAGAAVDRTRLATLDRLQQAQADGGSAFPSADLFLKGAEGAGIITSAADLRTAFAEGRRRDMAAGRTLVGPHRDDMRAVYQAKGVDAKNCSTGEQKALLVSLMLANARAVAQDFGAQNSACPKNEFMKACGC